MQSRLGVLYFAFVVSAIGGTKYALVSSVFGYIYNIICPRRCQYSGIAVAYSELLN